MLGVRYEFECYDTPHLHNLHCFHREGLVKCPLFIQTVFGLLGGIGSHPDEVMHMKRTADRLFGKDYRWSVLRAGRAQMQVAAMAMAAAMGGNVVDRRWPTRREQRSTSPLGAQDRRRAGPRSRYPRRSPRDPSAQG